MRRICGALVALVLSSFGDVWVARLGAQPAGVGYPAVDRPVSRIVAPSWRAEDDRDDAGEFAAVAKALDIRRGQVVADIGAGSGYYVARLSPLVGATGVVYAEDIIPRYLEQLRRRVADEGYANVRVIEGTPDNPRLPDGSVDVALMIHMYHEIESPYPLLARLTPAMRSSGRLAILDIDGPTNAHGTPLPLLKCELAVMGWTFDRSVSTGPSEYLAVFRAPVAAPTPAAVRAALATRPCRP